MSSLKERIQFNLTSNAGEQYWKSKVPDLKLRKKPLILWNFRSMMDILKSISNPNDPIDISSIKHIKNLESIMEMLDRYYSSKTIDSSTYSLLYNKIKDVLYDMQSLTLDELEEFNLSPLSEDEENKLIELGWSKEIVATISACKKVNHTMQLLYGPSHNNEKIATYKDNLLDELRRTNPIFSFILEAAERQKNKFKDGSKLVLILSTSLIVQIETFLRFDLRPKDVKKAYKQALTNALEILKTLSFEPDDDINNSNEKNTEVSRRKKRERILLNISNYVFLLLRIIDLSPVLEQQNWNYQYGWIA